MIVIIIAIVSYTIWTFARMIGLIVDMLFASAEYRDGKRYPFARMSHQYSFWKSLLWVRGK